VRALSHAQRPIVVELRDEFERAFGLPVRDRILMEIDPRGVAKLERLIRIPRAIRINDVQRKWKSVRRRRSSIVAYVDIYWVLRRPLLTLSCAFGSL
jgi:hypothetical protein